MSTFSMKRSFSSIPMEETTFTDTSQKVKTIHSLIDKGISGMIEKSFGTNSDNVLYFAIDLTDASEGDFGTILGNILKPIYQLDIAITSAYTGTEDEDAGFALRISGTEVGRVVGVGNFISIPMNGTLSGSITMIPLGVNQIPHIEMMVGAS